MLLQSRWAPHEVEWILKAFHIQALYQCLLYWSQCIQTAITNKYCNCMKEKLSFIPCVNIIADNFFSLHWRYVLPSVMNFNCVPCVSGECYFFASRSGILCVVRYIAVNSSVFVCVFNSSAHLKPWKSMSFFWFFCVCVWLFLYILNIIQLRFSFCTLLLYNLLCRSELNIFTITCVIYIYKQINEILSWYHCMHRTTHLSWETLVQEQDR